NQWRTEIRRTREGFTHIRRFSKVQASLSYARIADPDSAGRFFQIANASLESFDPPLTVRRLSSAVKHVGDSIWIESRGFPLRSSKGREPYGKLVWGHGIPMRYDIHIIGDQVAMSDIAWIYPT